MALFGFFKGKKRKPGTGYVHSVVDKAQLATIIRRLEAIESEEEQLYKQTHSITLEWRIVSLKNSISALKERLELCEEQTR